MFALSWPYSFSPSARLNGVFCPWGLIAEFYTDLLSSAGIILSMCSRLDVEMATFLSELLLICGGALNAGWSGHFLRIAESYTNLLSNTGIIVTQSAEV